MKQLRNFTETSSERLNTGSDSVAQAMPPGYAGDMYESDWEAPLLPAAAVARTDPTDTFRSIQMSSTILKKTSDFQSMNETRELVRRVPIAILGTSLGLLLSLTFVLCVLFDLWFPNLAMNSAWAVLLPGFTWISWPSFFLGLVETFAYGWYIALLFGVIHNFLLRRAA